MNIKLHELSYDTLYDIKNMLNDKIEKEIKAVNLLNINDGILSRLQNDRKLITKAILKVLEINYYNIEKAKTL